MREVNPNRPSRFLFLVGAALLTATLAASLGTGPLSSGADGKVSQTSSTSADED
ncbi:hypothetical protein [Streptomyces hypolithicus]